MRRRQNPLNRRELLKLGAATAALGASGHPLIRAVGPPAASAEPLPQNVLLNSYGFAVDIPGAPHASRSIREIQIDAIEVDASATGPGQAHLGSAYFTVPANPVPASELQTWFDEAVAGHCTRKNITVTLFKSDGTPGRTYSLHDCFPTQWSTTNFETSSSVQTETLTVRVDRIEMA